MAPRTTRVHCEDQFASRDKLFQHLPGCPRRGALSEEDDFASDGWRTPQSGGHDPVPGLPDPTVAGAPDIRKAPGLPDLELAAIPGIRKVDLFGDGSAFVLENLLTPGECRRIIETGERLGLRGCPESHSIRVADRVVMPSQEAASLLFERVRPFLRDTLDLRGGDRGLRSDLRPTRWRPTNLNSHFRLCRYESGGFFLPHYDGPYDGSRACCSLQTCMVYLNTQGSDFEGGRTRFYSERQQQYWPGRPEHVTAAYQPKAGSALIFNHLITHDGEEVASGRKYILRSEVMYTPQHLSQARRGVGGSWAPLEAIKNKSQTIRSRCNTFLPNLWIAPRIPPART